MKKFLNTWLFTWLICHLSFMSFLFFDAPPRPEFSSCLPTPFPSSSSFHVVIYEQPLRFAPKNYHYLWTVPKWESLISRNLHSRLKKLCRHKNRKSSSQCHHFLTIFPFSLKRKTKSKQVKCQYQEDKVKLLCPLHLTSISSTNSSRKIHISSKFNSNCNTVSTPDARDFPHLLFTADFF